MTVAKETAATNDGSRGDRPYRGRFAPSPSGWLHLGNASTALLAWLRARANGGAFIMRVEDLDGPRTLREAVMGNLEELRWLGLDWDEGPDVGGPHAPYLQSQRTAHYEAALKQLTAAGRTFPCYLSRKDLAEVASAPHGPNAAGTVYGAAEKRANDLTAPAKRAAGKPASVRFEVEGRQVKFEDALEGPQAVDTLTEVGHFVIRRSDGLFAYQLAVVVDDAAMGITEVVRGADLLQSTAAQLLLYEALGLPTPRFAHAPLILDDSGQRLAKRRGSQTLNELRATGALPTELVGMLAHGLGLLPEPRPLTPYQLLDLYEP